MNAIILAAGMGTRLKELTADKPKALVKVGPKTLIEHVLEMILFAEIEKIIVVTGSGHQQLKPFILNKYGSKNIVIVENSSFHKGNLYSLQCALPYVDDGFFLTNVDHIFSKNLMLEMKNQAQNLENFTLFSDNQKLILDDQMKIMAEGDSVHRIAKILTEYNHGYNGADFCPKNVLEKFKSEIFNVQGEQACKEDLFNYLIEKGEKVVVKEINGHHWFELDTPEDLNIAEQLLHNTPHDWA